MAFRILLVCSNNVCRSPTAALLLHNRLSAMGIADRIEVATAGTVAADGQPWCPRAAHWVGDVEGRVSLIAGHTSRPLVRELIRDANVILGAHSSHRSFVNRSLPAAARYTFTLREAAVLGTAVAEEVKARRRAGRTYSGESGGLELAPVPSDAPLEGWLTWLVDEMHAVRGVVRIPEEVSGKRWRRHHEPSCSLGYDIPDPHVDPAPRHGRALKMVQQAVDAWADAVAAVLSCRQGPGYDPRDGG